MSFDDLIINGEQLDALKLQVEWEVPESLYLPWS
jgi:hypothetical protein